MSPTKMASSAPKREGMPKSSFSYHATKWHASMLSGHKHKRALLHCIYFFHNENDMLQSLKILEELEELLPFSNEK